ncbi:hypothetical protein SERLA73DRAFT_51420, partial [Serpula lacrymans var. lacrymans S7.3]
PVMASDRQSSSKRTTEDEETKPYIIVSDIGKGSFATVYKGYHEETHHQVAIKSVRRDILTAKLLDNLQSEIDILKSLSHRHITKLIDIVRAERNIYLIMEYCSGGDLTNYIKKRGRVEGLEYAPAQNAALQYYPHPRSGGLDEIVVRSFLRQLARALKFLRNRNLIHRDIKPQNLLLNPASPEELARGHPLGVPILKIADFGFARSLPNAMMAETLCGSPLYMAPEILRYEKYDAKADLWSVGAVLYEMAVGKPPYRAMNHVELLKKIEHSKGVKFPDEDPSRARAYGTPPAGTPGALTGVAGDELIPVPSDVKDLIRALLKRQPAERASFEEFFGSVALAKSKFPRPTTSREGGSAARVPSVSQNAKLPVVEDETYETPDGRIPEHHMIIPPEVLDPNVMIPPSKFHFRRKETGVTNGANGGHAGEAGPSSRSRCVALPPRFMAYYEILIYAHSSSSHGKAPSTSPANLARVRTNSNTRAPVSEKALQRRPGPKPLSTEGSIIPGESEEDGILRREYVLVGDIRAVEFNRAVDGLSIRDILMMQWMIEFN